MLDKLSSTIWGWRYPARLIPYYGVMDLIKYEDAKKNYEDKVWDYLKDLRIQSSKARQLLSEDIYQKFHGFYNYIVAIDLQVNALTREKDKDKFSEAAKNLSDVFREDISEKIEDILITIASDLNLTSSTSQSKSGK